MYIDKDLKISDAQAVTATAASTDYIDTSAAGDAYGKELWFVVRCHTTAASSGSTTVDIALQTDSATGFGTATSLYQKTGIAKASITANTELVKVKVPPGASRYIRAYYTVNTADLTAGKLDAYFTDNVKIGSQ